MRPRQLLHTSGLALLPAVHVSSDEPIKATDEHTHSVNSRPTVSTAPNEAFPRPVTGQDRAPGQHFHTED